MTINKITIYITIISIVLIIGIPTLYKVINKNHDRLYLVNEKLAVEAAQKCFIDEKCIDTKITLDQLYKNKYLSEQLIDPVTKAIYNKGSYVEIKKDGSTFHLVH